MIFWDTYFFIVEVLRDKKVALCALGLTMLKFFLSVNIDVEIKFSPRGKLDKSLIVLNWPIKP